MIARSAELEFDVVIVGGGPAGLATALALGPARKTLVLEKLPVPRRKSCGGLLGPLSLGLLSEMGLEMPEWVRAQPYRPGYLRYVSIDNASDRRVPNAELVNVHREAFDYWLWQQASLTSTCMAGAECTSLTPGATSDAIVLDIFSSLASQCFRVKAMDVVVADGAGSRIRRELTGREPELAVTIQEAIEPTRPLVEAQDEVAFILATDVTPLYSWLIPKGSHFLLGSAFHGVEKLDRRFAVLKNHVGSIVGLSGDVLWRDVSRASVVRDIEHVDLEHDRVRFVGEAAGLLNQATGEGLSFALQSGVLCASDLLGCTPPKIADGRESLLKRLQDSLAYSLFLNKDPMLLRQYMLRHQFY